MYLGRRRRREVWGTGIIARADTDSTKRPPLQGLDRLDRDE